MSTVIISVEGRCPQCGHEELKVNAANPKVYCHNPQCTRPDAVTRLLKESDPDHVLVVKEGFWTLKHPLRERLEGDLFGCEIANAVAALDGVEVEGDGRYHVSWEGPDNKNLAFMPITPVGRNHPPQTTYVDIGVVDP